MDFRQFIESSINIQGLDADDIVARLPSMSFAQQAEVDKALHDKAIHHGTFSPMDSKALSQDEGIKTAFQRILQAAESGQPLDKKLIYITMNQIERDQKRHKEYLGELGHNPEKTGDKKWHYAWILTYDGWLKHLRILLGGTNEKI